MIGIIISFAAGLIFAIGLVVSGMTNPQKVTGFLDILRNWDPSLLFVMGGAVGFNFISFKILSNKKPFCAPAHFFPEKKELDKRLIIGSMIFGIGWGLAGICPGPGLVNLVTGNVSSIIFVVSMLAGMLIFKKVEKNF